MNACAISPDGSLLATAGDDKRLCVTSLSTHDLVYTANCDDSVLLFIFYFFIDRDALQVSGTAWSPIGTYVVGVTQSGSVIKVDVALKSHATIFKFNEMVRHQLVFCQSLTLIPLGCCSPAVRVRDPAR